ncbi:hypothetical protein NDU88_007218 [Pleurodeles waltl]|uniref:Uncharacterized protein n=1 Tax=Pleurodeles waltl TaxID=8319 RepID=A0AAV7VT67_PLEWA|nr:hypothetical protein NDU88_007218 [Pleurodeles waltl]
MSPRRLGLLTPPPPAGIQEASFTTHDLLQPCFRRLLGYAPVLRADSGALTTPGTPPVLTGWHDGTHKLVFLTAGVRALEKGSYMAAILATPQCLFLKAALVHFKSTGSLKKRFPSENANVGMRCSVRYRTPSLLLSQSQGFKNSNLPNEL